jgi:hypothetical protein
MVSDTLNRVGDEIKIKGVSIKMMIELHPNYSDVPFRLLVIRCAKGDVVTAATLFRGQSANKMLDTFNTERYSIIFQKYYKLTARQPVSNSTSLQAGMAFADFTGATSTPQLNHLMGVYPQGGSSFPVLSSATKMIKVYIPGKRIVRNGHLKYENGSDQPKFFGYKVVMFAYANGRTGTNTSTGGVADPSFIVGYINDKITTTYYKDA